MPCHPNLEEAAAVETFLVRVVFIYQGTSGDLLSLLAAAVAALVHERKLALALAASSPRIVQMWPSRKSFSLMLPRLTTALAFVIMHSIVLPKHPNECPKSQYCMAHLYILLWCLVFAKKIIFYYIGKYILCPQRKLKSAPRTLWLWFTGKNSELYIESFRAMKWWFAIVHHF